MPEREFNEIIIDASRSPIQSHGTMAQSKTDSVSVLFQCDAKGDYVRKAIYVVGNQKSLGDWKPNVVRMYDDGSHGDERQGDGVWSLELRFPVGTEIQYKFTNSGPNGEWSPGEELPGGHRKIYLDGSTERVVLRDVFGKQ